ncbi:MAG: site-2 protease family protein [Kiritimatiellia bacterium]
MKSAYQIGQIWGIPLKIHISLFLLLAYISLHAYFATVGANGFLRALLVVIAVVILQISLFASIGLHELGHSFVAIRKGCKVREITLLIIGGAAVMENIPRRPKDEFTMAIAGPAVSATLAILFGLLSLRFPMESAETFVAAGLALFFFYLALGNAILATFNLLPAYPMDGGRITRALLTPHLGRLRATRFAMIAGRIIAVLIALVAIRGIPPWLVPWNIPLLLIAGFVFVTGNREYRQVQLETLLEQRGFARHFHDAGTQTNEPPIDDETVLISPPPYSNGPADRAHIEKLAKRHFPFI